MSYFPAGLLLNPSPLQPLVAKGGHAEPAGRAAHSAPIRTLPADTARRTRLYGEGWVVVGEAAITLDPLSSQGIVTGVLMGAWAGPAIISAMGEGQTSLLQAWDRDYRLLWAEHQSLRSHYAHAENRWPDFAYWGRRRR